MITLTEYQDKLRQLASAGAEKAMEAIIVPAANELLANIKNRIIREGRKSDGSVIGNYSVKPAYFEREQFIQQGKFKPQGKTGKAQFKSGAFHKSMYLKSGYKELRDIQGRPTDKINEFYSGSTMLSYVLQAKDKEVLLGLSNEKSAKIRAGQEKRFGAIFSATEQEKKEYSDNVAKQSNEFVTKIFNG